ncbi:MAG: AMP-binding protein, partial [Deltaproteobacteria bacterium]|nr:AMP-binding protein [Deltaproteobacteria bacterium]
MRLRDLIRGAVRMAPRAPRAAHAMLTVARSDPSTRLSMGAWVERNSRRHRDQPALLFEESRWTWRELNLVANRWAHALTQHGVRRGDVVALGLESRPELMFAVIALAKLGAVSGLVNSSLAPESLAHSLRVVDPSFWIIGQEVAPGFGRVFDGVPGARRRLYVADTWSGARAEEPPPGWTSLDRAVSAAGRGNPDSTRKITLGERLFTIPTSGT